MRFCKILKDCILIGTLQRVCPKIPMLTSVFQRNFIVKKPKKKQKNDSQQMCCVQVIEIFFIQHRFLFLKLNFYLFLFSVLNLRNFRPCYVCLPLLRNILFIKISSGLCLLRPEKKTKKKKTKIK